MKHFKVFCADCKVEYEQKSDEHYPHAPQICGYCGSFWIAVKEIAPPEVCDMLEEMEQMEILRDLDREPEEINEL